MDTLPGMAANRMWVEMLRRERQLESTLTEHSLLMTYIMAGVPPQVEYEKRHEWLSPSLKKVLAEINQTAYSVQYRKGLIQHRLSKLDERESQMAMLDAMSSDTFSIQDWMKQGPSTT